MCENEQTIWIVCWCQELQLLLLKYREDVIVAKVGAEHQEETLRSEIMFLKSQLVAEQQERTKIEESLSTEITQLQDDLGIHFNNILLCSFESDFYYFNLISTKMSKQVIGIFIDLNEKKNVLFEENKFH